MSDAYAVLWGDLRALKRRFWRIFASSIMSPLLYLVAFGWGLGRGVQMENADYLHFVIPGIVALAIMNASYNGAGTKLNVAKLYYHTWDEYMMAPVSVPSLVVGKAMLGVVRGLLSAALLVAMAAIVAPDLRITPLLVLTLFLTSLTFGLMGVLAALLAKSHDDMATFSSLVLLPMTFLGGTFFSVATLPSALRALIYVLPLTHVSKCLRAEALGWPFPWVSLAVVAAYGVLFFAACVRLGRTASV